jgi:hypothetical protein
MLDRELLRRSPDLVRQGISRKGMDPGLVDAFLFKPKVTGLPRASAR